MSLPREEQIEGCNSFLAKISTNKTKSHPAPRIRMSTKSKKLEWLIVSLRDDLNWWVIEVSENIPWDLDNLGIIDPKQWAYLIDLLDALREYGLDTDIVEAAFIPYSIDKDLGDQQIRLLKSSESLFDSEEILFILPDAVEDDETGPFADFLDHITTLRVKLLNDLIDFEKNMTITELEEDLRDEMSNQFFEGKNLHYFSEITAILDYTPAGYSLDEDDDEEKPVAEEEEIVEEIPDLEDSDEVIAPDDTMKWDDDDEEEEEEEDEDDDDLVEVPGPPDFPDDDEDEEGK